MNIAHVLPALTKGGAERVVVELANRAADKGHEVSLVVARDTPRELWPAPLDDRVSVRLVAPDATRTGTYRLLPAWLRANRSWLLGQDVVHCHLTFGTIVGSLLTLVRGRSKLPVIVETNHAVGMAISSFRRGLHAAALRRRDAVSTMVLDRYWRAFFAAKGAPRVQVIANGVSPAVPPLPAKVAAFRASIGIPTGVTVVGSVGRMVHERRPDLVVDAFERLACDRKSDVHLVFGGEGPLRRDLMEWCSRAGLSGRVHLPGLITDLSTVLGCMDLYIAINVGSATGVAAMEAAQAGVPVVAVQMDPDHQNRGNDWIWSSLSPTDLGVHISRLLDDRAALGRLAKKQQAYVRKYHSAATMADAHLELYADLLRSDYKGEITL